MKQLSLEYVKDRLKYDDGTGTFIWKPKIGDDKETRRWNTRFGNQIAGCPNKQGYIVITIDDRQFKAHRIAWFLMTNEWPAEEIDHRNCVVSDNSFANLRLASAIQNGHNKNKLSNNTSGYKGVSWCKRDKRWIASIKISGKPTHIGSFLQLDDAVAAYNSVAKNHQGDFCHYSILEMET